MARFILVHGAMHGGWCWERIVPLLQAAGHEVAVIDLPGSDGVDPPESVNMTRYTDALVKLLDGEAEPVILVGHSLGGMAVSAAAERRPDKVARLVYLAALLPRDGESAGSLMENNEDQSVISGFQFAADGHSFRMDPMLSPGIFYNHCDPSVAAAASARLSPQPIAVLAEPVRLTAERFGRIPKSYIATTDDHAVQYPFQRWMADRDLDLEVTTMDTGHSPFYSEPDALTALLIEQAR